MQENKKNNLLRRFIAAAILIPLVVAAIVLSKPLLQTIIIVVAIGMLVEWYDMTHQDICYMILGVPIIAIPMSCLMVISMIMSDYKYILLTYASMVWSVDSAAMFGGKRFGGPRLAPVLSPNKTWSGLGCGMIGASLVAMVLSQLPGFEFPYRGVHLVIFAMILAVIAQISDLFISFFKRKFDIKDTGSIIPGHGGILDRCDSLILTAPVMLWVVM